LAAKQETLDGFFRTELNPLRRSRIEAACVDRWEPFTTSILNRASQCRIVYDKFHVMQHANRAVDEVRRAESFRKGGRMRGVVKGKRWLLLTRWTNRDSRKRQLLNELFRINQRVMKAEPLVILCLHCSRSKEFRKAAKKVWKYARFHWGVWYARLLVVAAGGSILQGPYTMHTTRALCPPILKFAGKSE